MPDVLIHIVERIGKKALAKSRAYYCPPASSIAESTALSDAAFAAMLKEIDLFSAQLRAQPAPGERTQYHRNQSVNNARIPDLPQQTYHLGDSP